MNLIKLGAIGFAILFIVTCVVNVVRTIVDFFESLFRKVHTWMVTTWDNICNFFSEYGWIFITVLVVAAAIGIAIIAIRAYEEKTGRALGITRWLDSVLPF